MISGSGCTWIRKILMRYHPHIAMDLLAIHRLNVTIASACDRMSNLSTYKYLQSKYYPLNPNRPGTLL